MLSVVMVSVLIFYCYDKCHLAECHYAKYRYADCHYAKCHCAECRAALTPKLKSTLQYFTLVIATLTNCTCELTGANALAYNNLVL